MSRIKPLGAATIRVGLCFDSEASLEASTYLGLMPFRFCTIGSILNGVHHVVGSESTLAIDVGTGVEPDRVLIVR